MFNILVITGVSAVAANQLRIHMFAVRRDTVYYLFAIGYLAFIFQDGEVVLVEAIFGLVAYAVYVGLRKPKTIYNLEKYIYFQSTWR